jgi:hypothetical protein
MQGRIPSVAARAMADHLTTSELIFFRRAPEEELVELAIELDIAVGEVMTVDRLLSEAVVRLAQLARREGLPLSHYAVADLRKLRTVELEALARLVGAAPTVEALVRSGERVYRAYNRRAKPSQIALFLPMLLAPLARHALATESDLR